MNIAVTYNTLDYLVAIRHELFGRVLNLSMSGDLTDINKAFSEGETYKFELAHFKDSDDRNVSKLVFLIEEIEETVDQLSDLNRIDVRR